jgi:signal transduction histidine kinase
MQPIMNTLDPDLNAKLLIVEDAPVGLQLLGGLLERRGFKVRLATSGEQALQAARDEPPDLILLDIHMPDMNGYEVCERLKTDEALKSIPIIFISSLRYVIDKVKAFGLGGVDYITKPYQFEDVEARVRSRLSIRRLEQQLQESLARLKDEERLRENLVHMIVHDMRSPLSGILACMNLLQASPQLDPATLQQIINSTHKAAAGLKEMTTQLLDVSRLEAGQIPINKEKHDLAESLRAAVESLSPQSGQRRVHVDAPASIMEVYDQDLVGRVVANLLANALKFTPPDGEIKLTLTRQSELVRVAVADTGRGIATEYHQKIFEKFAQAELGDKRVGTGLGLTFCKLAVEAHGGQIGVESEPGRGSTFWFTLPGKTTQ